MPRSSPNYKVGDIVVAVSENFGWGLVSPGDVGIITGKGNILSESVYEVKFVQQDSWKCLSRNIKKATAAMASAHRAMLVTPSLHSSVPLSAIPAFAKGNSGITITFDELTKTATNTTSKAPVKRNRLPGHLKGLKVGDEVAVIGSNDGSFEVGDIVEVDHINYDDKQVRAWGIDEDGDRETYWISFKDITTDLDNIPGKVHFDSVILDDVKKEKILTTIKQVDNHKLIFEDWGFGNVLEKGKAISMLFWGPPGTGKTLMAQAIADKMRKKLKVIGSAEIESSEPGQAERNIKAFFEGADKNTVLLFDECDSLVYSRENVGSILAAQVNQLLSSLEKYEGIVIFTTNRLGVLDEAFNRRLSLKLEFAMPNAKERVKIWQRMFPKQAPVADDVDWVALADVELSGGYIKNAVLRAARAAAAMEMEDKDKQITMQHLIEALADEAESVIEFEEARANNHTPRLMGGGVSRGSTHAMTRGTGTSR